MTRLASAMAVLVVVIIGAGPAMSQHKLDYNTPAIEAHASLVALSQSCKTGITDQLNSSKASLKSTVLKHGWSSARFDTVYAATYADVVRKLAAATPAQRSAACAKMKAMREGKVG